VLTWAVGKGDDETVYQRADQQYAYDLTNYDFEDQRMNCNKRLN
jgi:hypothetical protein